MSEKLRVSIWFCFSDEEKGRDGWLMFDKRRVNIAAYSGVCLYLRSILDPLVWLLWPSAVYRPIWLWEWPSDCSLSPSDVAKLSSSGASSL